MEQAFRKKIYPIYLTDFIKEMVQRLAMPVWGWLWQKQSSINQGGIIRAKNRELGGAEFEICFYRGTTLM